MSTFIAFRHCAMRLPIEAFEGRARPHGVLIYEDQFILFREGGPSNCFDHTGRVARAWSAVAHGMRWEVMRAVVQDAALCEGAMLKLENRPTAAEDYISALRPIVAAAGVPGSSPELPYAVTGTVRIADEDVAGFQDYERERLAALEARHEAQPGSPSSAPTREWTFNLLDPDGYIAFQAYRHLAGRRANGSWSSPEVWSQVKPAFH